MDKKDFENWTSRKWMQNFIYMFIHISESKKFENSICDACIFFCIWWCFFVLPPWKDDWWCRFVLSFIRCPMDQRARQRKCLITRPPTPLCLFHTRAKRHLVSGIPLEGSGLELPLAAMVQDTASSPPPPPTLSSSFSSSQSTKRKRLNLFPYIQTHQKLNKEEKQFFFSFLSTFILY